MLEQLRQVRRRYQEVELSLRDPAVLADNARCASLMREYRRLTPLMEAFGRYEAACADCAEARALLEEGGLEPEFREMVQAQYAESRDKLEPLEHQLRLLLLPRDENDERNIILEIRGGAGGEEAALFAGTLLRMYSLYAAARGWKYEVLNLSATELGGVREASVSIQGESVYSRLKYESGVHRVQRVPATETQGRIHTSTVTVAVLPEAEEVDLQLDPSELRIDTFRSSGAGGQHVNKTSSAIRITHLPTGMVVECQDERSQYKNKDKALKVLRSRLLAQKQQAQKDAQDADRRSQVGTGDRSERIRTYNFPQGRVTDHRIGLTLYKLDNVMNGALDEVLDALITADQTRRLQAAGGKWT